MLLSLGKLLALAVAGGGGVTVYYLANKTTLANSYESKFQGPDCSKPYLIKLTDQGYNVFARTREEAEQSLKDYYGNKGEINLQQNDQCPQWKTLEK